MEGGRKADLAAAYHKEYQAFIQKLEKFHESRGFAFQRAPTFSGRPIDLYVFYKTVTSLGGLCKVTDDRRWPEVAACFDLPSRCTNVCYALRQHYIRYLEAYEKANFLGEDDSTSHDARSFTYHGSASHHGTSSFIPLSSQTSAQFGPLGEPRISNFNRLMFSLTSGLQNEVDFSLNICMLLSNVTNSIFNLAKSPRMVDLMLAHIGIIDADELRELYKEWYKKSNRNFNKAWCAILDNEFGKNLFSSIHPGHTQSTAAESSVIFASDWRAEQHRIQQVAVILYNFSFEQINAYFLADKPTCLNFLMLSCSCQIPSVRRLALETFDNIADSIVLSTRESAVTQSILLILNNMLLSSDRFQCAKAMMILSKLCTLPENIGAICEGFDDQTYSHVIAMLTLPDIQLILSSLDLLYSLSSFGHVPCSAIASIYGAIDTLVTLISVHAESYGNEAIAGFKIVENKNSISAQKAQQEKSMRTSNPSVSGVTANQIPTRQPQPLGNSSASSHANNSMTTMNGMSDERERNAAVVSTVTIQPNTTPLKSMKSPENGKIQHTPLIPINGLPSDTMPISGTGHSPLMMLSANECNGAISSKAIHTPSSDTVFPSTLVNGEAGKEQAMPLNGRQVILQCQTIMEQIKKEIQQHFVQFHHHRQQIEIIQMQLQQVMQQQQQQQQNSSQAATLPANIMTEVQSKVKTHHSQMQMHYNKLQHLQMLSQQIQHKINLEEENLKHQKETADVTDNVKQGKDTPTPIKEPQPLSNGPSLPHQPIVNGIMPPTLNGTVNSSPSATPLVANGLPAKRKITDTKQIHSSEHKLSRPMQHSHTVISSKDPLPINGLKANKQNKRHITKLSSRRPLHNINDSQYMSDGGLRAAACIPCCWKDCKTRGFSTTGDLMDHMIACHAPSEGDHTQTVCLVVGCDSCNVSFTKHEIIDHFKAVHCVVDSHIRNALDWSNRIDPSNHLLPDWLISSRAEACAPEDESPVTRSVRLTASLVLRNIARYSPRGKRALTELQGRLASVAMTTSEASNATSYCLFELSRISSDNKAQQSLSDSESIINSIPVDYT